MTNPSKQSTKTTTAYIATIKVVVKAESEAEACDAISESLRESVWDWCYLAAGELPTMANQSHPGNHWFTTPTRIEIPADYQEGDAFV